MQQLQPLEQQQQQRGTLTVRRRVPLAATVSGRQHRVWNYLTATTRHVSSAPSTTPAPEESTGPDARVQTPTRAVCVENSSGSRGPATKASAITRALHAVNVVAPLIRWCV